LLIYPGIVNVSEKSGYCKRLPDKDSLFCMEEYHMCIQQLAFIL